MFGVSFARCQASRNYVAFGADWIVQAIDQMKPTISRAMAAAITLAVLPRARR